jgi:hypothetical protein
MYLEIQRVSGEYDAIVRDRDLNEIGRFKAALTLYSSGSVDLRSEPRRVVPEVITGHSLDEDLVMDWLDYRIPVAISGAFLRVTGAPKRIAEGGEWKTSDWKSVFDSVPP